MISALFWVVTERVVINPYRRFGTTYMYLLQGDFWPLRMGPIGSPETFLRIYHYTLRKSAEERGSYIFLYFYPFVCFLFTQISQQIYVLILSFVQHFTDSHFFYSILLIMAVQPFEVGATQWHSLYTRHWNFTCRYMFKLWVSFLEIYLGNPYRDAN